MEELPLRPAIKLRGERKRHEGRLKGAERQLREGGSGVCVCVWGGQRV